MTCQLLCATSQIQLSLSMACVLRGQVNRMPQFENEVASTQLIMGAGYPKRRKYQEQGVRDSISRMARDFSKNSGTV
jgi:hypothetical protein